MALSIKDPETDALVRRLASERGVNYTAAVRLAVSNELARPRRQAKDPAEVMRAIKRIQAEVAKLPVLDSRSADEILGHDEDGLTQ
ncbi:MAG: type II toxin-antitoxin system VapB family antitoxin [Novosphingobium sp.]|nr:type II toxin-antitoxin system VapB family antitoxin [Novosphingobium sp.]